MQHIGLTVDQLAPQTLPDSTTTITKQRQPQMCRYTNFNSAHTTNKVCTHPYLLQAHAPPPSQLQLHHHLPLIQHIQLQLSSWPMPAHTHHWPISAPKMRPMKANW